MADANNQEYTGSHSYRSVILVDCAYVCRIRGANEYNPPILHCDRFKEVCYVTLWPGASKHTLSQPCRDILVRSHGTVVSCKPATEQCMMNKLVPRHRCVRAASNICKRIRCTVDDVPSKCIRH
jgi:hypothetical protein